MQLIWEQGDALQTFLAKTHYKSCEPTSCNKPFCFPGLMILVFASEGTGIQAESCFGLLNPELRSSILLMRVVLSFLLFSLCGHFSDTFATAQNLRVKNPCKAGLCSSCWCKSSSYPAVLRNSASWCSRMLWSGSRKNRW